MRYIVTGGSGLLGGHLREIMPELIYLSSRDCDLTNQAAVKSLFEEIKPDGVVHLAAKVGGILQNRDFPADFFDANIQMNSNTLIAARDTGVKKFLAILSTCMYPDVLDTYPMTEEDVHKGPPAQANLSYAYTKRSMSVHIDACNKQYGLNYNYLIPCSLYGEHDNFDDSNKSHFITALIKKIVDAERRGDKKITLFGTGKPLRQFMHSSDLARVIKKVVEENITENFNVAPPNQNLSIDDMARIALRLSGNEDWTIEYDSTKPDGQFRKDVSCDKMIKCLGDFQFTNFEEGLRRLYENIKLKYEE
tara:strand:+ start:6360 stop:7277 length:918 start_codon:yes stop_codon:yes gene_type:complete